MKQARRRAASEDRSKVPEYKVAEIIRWWLEPQPTE